MAEQGACLLMAGEQREIRMVWVPVCQSKGSSRCLTRSPAAHLLKAPGVFHAQHAGLSLIGVLIFNPTSLCLQAPHTGQSQLPPLKMR